MTKIVPNIETTTFFARARTRNGTPVELRWQDDVSQPNRGFVDCEMSAWIPGSGGGLARAGFLLSSQVTRAALDIYQPTVWHYAMNICGHHIDHIHDNTRDRRAIHPEALDRDAFSAFSASVQCTLSGNPNSRDPGYRDYAQMMEDIRHQDAFLRLNMKWFRFLHHHLEKPHVAYISTARSAANDMLHDNRGRGIALLLYTATAKYLHKTGLSLHASDIQSDKARRIWSLFDEMGWVQRAPRLACDLDRDGKPRPARRYLDADRACGPETVLEHALSYISMAA